jgi:hypothetical protein
MMTRASMSSSSAASIVVASADRIQFSDPRSILERLEKESIKEDWQLQYLDSIQWQALEVPMGLVSSIRHCLEERKRSRSSLPPSATRSPVPRRSPIPRMQASSFMSPSDCSYSHSELMKSLRGEASMMISLDDGGVCPCPESPKSSSNEDSLSTLFPPSMPTRRSSHGIRDESTDVDQWNSSLNDLSDPPVAPKRSQSVDREDIDWEVETAD